MPWPTPFCIWCGGGDTTRSSLREMGLMGPEMAAPVRLPGSVRKNRWNSTRGTNLTQNDAWENS